jgi:hypothetical protein
MIRTVSILIICTLFLGQSVFGEELSVEKMRALAKQKDDRSKVPEALKVYPQAIEYSLSVRAGAPGNMPKEPVTVVAREALVEGKYLVTTFRPPAYKEDLITVVYFDEADDCYRSATLLPDGSLGRSVGTKNRDTRVISWAGVPAKPGDEKATILVAQDVLSDKDRHWREVMVQDGKVVSILEAVATVTKKPQ